MAVITCLIPAHNEELLIAEAIRGLQTQTRVPDKIVVVCDNCTDATEEIARGLGVAVFTTSGNTDKKAGALNAALASLNPDGLVLVQDADSILHQDFVENAERHLLADPCIGAVGGTFRAVELESTASWSARLLRHLQDNEYARYARDVRRLKGKCLVVTGTAALLRAETLREVSAARISGALPSGDGRGGVYDTTVLTEDNELSFAIMTLGYRLYAPSDCLLVTDSMTSVPDLWAQRLRWKRGAVENCVQYGFTRVTAPYWGRQALSVLGVIVTACYLASLVLSFALAGGISVQPFWLAVTGIFILERVVTLADRKLRWRLLAATLYELPYDIFLQAVHARAYVDSILKTKKVW